MANDNPFAKLKMQDKPAKDHEPSFATPKDKLIKMKKDVKLPNGGVEITDKVKIDFEPVLKETFGEFDADDLVEGDYTDLEEHTELLEAMLAEIIDLGEDLTAAQRAKKKLLMRRYKSKIKIGRRRSMRRRATTQKITQRARKSAVNNWKRRFAGGRNPQSLSVAEKNRVERMVRQRKNAIARSARKLIRSKRELERKRLQGRKRS